jgi:hypothetical protein
MMPPSTAIVITFDETVQAGTGAVSFGSSTEVAVSDCQFSTKFMRCKPSGDLAKNTAYDVQFTKSAVTDVAGNTMRDATIGSTNSKLTFTTVDLDYMPPLLAAASGVTYASTTTASVAANTVDYAKPYDPVNGATQVAKGTLISMTFSETVALGTASLLLGGSSMTNPQSFIVGTTVYWQKADLNSGTTYAVTTNGANLVKDLSNQPLASISSGWSFTVVTDDTVAPSILQMLPKDDTTLADDSPSTLITLYFTEAVQAMAGGKVTVGSVAIPVDNTDISKGTVTVVGAAVSIDPFADANYNEVVTINVGGSAFKDLFSANAFTQKNRGLCVQDTRI